MPVFDAPRQKPPSRQCTSATLSSRRASWSSLLPLTTREVVGPGLRVPLVEIELLGGRVEDREPHPNAALVHQLGGDPRTRPEAAVVEEAAEEVEGHGQDEVPQPASPALSHHALERQI